MRQIYLSKNGQQQGPFPEDQVVAGLQSGQHAPDTLCWHDGLAEWKPLSEVIALPVQPLPPVPSVLFVMHDGQQQGPLSEADIRERLKNGSLSTQDFAWKEGMAEWQPLPTVMAGISAPNSGGVLRAFLNGFRKGMQDRRPGGAAPSSSPETLPLFRQPMSKWGIVAGAVAAVFTLGFLLSREGESPSGGTGTPTGFNQGISGAGVSKANHNTPLDSYIQLTGKNAFLYYFALSGAQMSNQIFESYVVNHMGNSQNRPSQQDSFAWQAYLDSMRPQLRMELDQIKQSRYIRFSTNFQSCPKSYDFGLKGFPFGSTEYDLPTNTMFYMKAFFLNPEKFSVLRVPEDQARLLSQKLGDRGCNHVDIYAYAAAAGDRDGRGALLLEPTQIHIKLNNGETFIYRPQ